MAGSASDKVKVNVKKVLVLCVSRKCGVLYLSSLAFLTPVSSASSLPSLAGLEFTAPHNVDRVLVE